MTKPARVISFLSLGVIFLIIAAKVVAAQFILPPLELFKPSVSFGDILGTASVFSPTPTAGFDSKAQAVKNFLAKLTENGKESWDNFNSNKNDPNSVPVQHTYTLLTDATNTAPTPPAFATALVQNIGDLVTTPIPTLNPKLEAVMLANTQRKIADSQQSTVYSLPSTNNSQLPAPSSSLPTSHTGDLTQNPIKTTYTIAILGDSMVDTLGKSLSNLKSDLSAAYPKLSFALLNYGQGATDIENGLNRLTNASTYLGNYAAPLLSFNPDIVVVESFAYNHWSASQSDLDRQWLAIAHIIDAIKTKSATTKIILAAAIAPNARVFGDGVLNWPADLKWQAAQTTKAYLENMVRFATSQNYPLANAYHPSLGTDGNGLLQYINAGDHLHPSPEGAALFSQKIVEAIKENHLIN